MNPYTTSKDQGRESQLKHGVQTILMSICMTCTCAGTILHTINCRLHQIYPSAENCGVEAVHPTDVRGLENAASGLHHLLYKAQDSGCLLVVTLPRAKVCKQQAISSFPW
jgi:hypothetical protein